jgi:hypothetical protein
VCIFVYDDMVDDDEGCVKLLVCVFETSACQQSE